MRRSREMNLSPPYSRFFRSAPERSSARRFWRVGSCSCIGNEIVYDLGLLIKDRCCQRSALRLQKFDRFRGVLGGVCTRHRLNNLRAAAKHRLSLDMQPSKLVGLLRYQSERLGVSLLVHL